MHAHPGIETNPDRRFGKPCIAGTRVDVATVLGALAGGESVEHVAEEYGLHRDQVLAALRFAAHLAESPPSAEQRRPR